MKRNTFRVPLPTESDGKWVTDSLLARNPELFSHIKKNNKAKSKNRNDLTPAQISQIVISVYIGGCGNRFN